MADLKKNHNAHAVLTNIEDEAKRIVENATNRLASAVEEAKADARLAAEAFASLPETVPGLIESAEAVFVADINATPETVGFFSKTGGINIGGASLQFPRSSYNLQLANDCRAEHKLPPGRYRAIVAIVRVGA